MKQFLIIALLYVFVNTTQYHPGLQSVHVSIQKVLDGYSKEFDAIVTELEPFKQLYFWLCLPNEDYRSFYSILEIQPPLQYFMPIAYGGTVLQIDYTAIVDDIVQIQDDDGTEALLLQIKRDVSKGTTMKIKFKEPEDQVLLEQEHIFNILSQSIAVEKPLIPIQIIEDEISIIEGKLIDFCENQVRNKVKKSWSVSDL